jgi:hypothetical protein
MRERRLSEKGWALSGGGAGGRLALSGTGTCARAVTGASETAKNRSVEKRTKTPKDG